MVRILELCVLDSTHSILRLPHMSLCSLCLSLEWQKSHQGLSLLVKVLKLWLPKVTWLHVLCLILSKPDEANHGALLFLFWKLSLFSPSNQRHFCWVQHFHKYCKSGCFSLTLSRQKGILSQHIVHTALRCEALLKWCYQKSLQLSI